MAEQRQQENPETGDEPKEEPQEELQDAPPTDDMTLVREELEEALREKDQFRTMAQRAQADLINFKRRASEEQQETRRAANSGLFLKFLSIVDDLDRALALIPEDAVAGGWLDGLKLIQRNIDNIFESEGVRKIEAQGKPFAPQEHEALAYEVTDDGDEDMVVRVIREGYMLRDRVLRAAQVAVSKAPEPESEPKESQEEA